MRVRVTPLLTLLFSCQGGSVTSETSTQPQVDAFRPPAGEESLTQLEGVAIISAEDSPENPNDEWSALVDISVTNLPGDNTCRATFQDQGSRYYPTEAEAELNTGCEQCEHFFVVFRTIVSHDGLCVWQLDAESMRIGVDFTNGYIRLLSDGLFTRRYLIEDVESSIDEGGSSGETGGTPRWNITFVGDIAAGFVD